MPPLPPTDDELFERILQKDVQALEQLYDRYAPHIFTIIQRIVKDQTIAEGVMQETFLQVWQKSSTYTRTGCIAAWVSRIARNKSLDHLRRSRVRPQTIFTAVEDINSLADQTVGVAMYVEQKVQHRHLQEALLQIPSEQAHCLRLAYFEGMSHQEIAVTTMTPLGTVKTRIRSGLSKLATLLQSYGYSSYDYVS